MRGDGWCNMREKGRDEGLRRAKGEGERGRRGRGAYGKSPRLHSCLFLCVIRDHIPKFCNIIGSS